MRRYLIDVEGFKDAYPYEAATASGARAQAYRALCSAGYRISFRDFLRRAMTIPLGPALPVPSDIDVSEIPF